MKLNKTILAVSLAGATVLSTSCRDEFTELNQSKTDITVADPSYLMAQAIINFEVSGYTYWFYNAPMYQRWSQMGMSSGGFNSTFTEQSETGDQGTQFISTLKYRNDINHLIEQDPEEGEAYKAYAAVCGVLSVYAAIFDSDIAGDIPYTEGAMLKYGGPLTPKYDRMEDLYPTWIEELDEAIATFSDDSQELANNGTQDAIYGGDLSKWAKLANSLKLKIAVRLLLNDEEEALSIAHEVATASCGYIDSEEDDMIFAKATTITSGDGDKVYHFGNNVLTSTAATANVIDFMLACKDPRVRFCYTKDEFNSTIVQGFIDAGRYDDLPTYVKQNVIRDADGNFSAWGGMGEPWVRYQGLPVVYEKQGDENYAEYFNPGTRFNLTIDNATLQYTWYSNFQEEMVRGRVDFTLPTLPNASVIQDTNDNPWYGMYLTSAEVNLYLAEFKLLGADLPQSAEYYYNRGVRASVEEYDRVAGLNNIPYYSQTYDYDPNEKAIALQDGEIDEMMATPEVQLTGSTDEQLEKVYLQQLMHFTLMPDDQFVTARRSGCPKVDSELLPFVEFQGVNAAAIPRRFSVSSPSPTDQMYDILVESYAAQGFTTGTNQSGGAYNSSSSVLNTERLWQDQYGPQWGTGPNY